MEPLRGRRKRQGNRAAHEPTPWTALSIPSSFFFPPFQDELLNELLAEMKALRAVVLAQNQRIELLERQLARIEDGDV